MNGFFGFLLKLFVNTKCGYPNMEIPHSQLSDKALRAIIEEFVTREGSEYGPIGYSFEDKVDHVIKQLERGEVVLTFDAASETCNLIPSR